MLSFRVLETDFRGVLSLGVLSSYLPGVLSLALVGVARVGVFGLVGVFCLVGVLDLVGVFYLVGVFCYEDFLSALLGDLSVLKFCAAKFFLNAVPKLDK